jgi:hypothetical protein
VTARDTMTSVHSGVTPAVSHEELRHQVIREFQQLELNQPESKRLRNLPAGAQGLIETKSEGYGGPVIDFAAHTDDVWNMLDDLMGLNSGETGI